MTARLVSFTLSPFLYAFMALTEWLFKSIEDNADHEFGPEFHGTVVDPVIEVETEEEDKEAA